MNKINITTYILNTYRLVMDQNLFEVYFNPSILGCNKPTAKAVVTHFPPDPKILNWFE